MKCPFRKTTKTHIYIEETITEEKFGECYKEECPFYCEHPYMFNLGQSEDTEIKPCCNRCIVTIEG